MMMMNPTTSTGYTGVFKSGKKFRAEIQINRKNKHLGSYNTAKEAALAFDRAVVKHKLLSSRRNFPDGLPLDDKDYDALMNPKKKRKRNSNNTTELYNGVTKRGERYQARLYFDGKDRNLGRHDTAKEAALAYDLAVTQHKLSSSRLNFPNGVPSNDEDYDELMNPTKKRRLQSDNTAGYNGVFKRGTMFQAKIKIGPQTKSLGAYGTAKEAALAFDRAIIQHKRPSSKLNFPNDYTTSSEDDDDESEDKVTAEPFPVQHKRPTSLLNAPDGGPIDKEDFDDTTKPTKPKKKKKRRRSANTTGYRGVTKKGRRFKAQLYFDGIQNNLGTYDTPKEAAVAYDRAVIQHKLAFSKLNFVPSDDESDNAPTNPKQKDSKRRLNTKNNTGYRGVYKSGKRFIAQISIKRNIKHLGTYDSSKEAALAYDRAVTQHKLPSTKLNYPNDYINSGEDDESSSDDDNDNEATHARSPFPPAQSAQSQFQGDPMLDQLVAAVEAQSKQ
jgi:hypothetical protein